MLHEVSFHLLHVVYPSSSVTVGEMSGSDEQSVMYGADVSLTCSRAPGDDVKWYINSEKQDKGVSDTDNESKLELMFSTPGIYQCEVTGSVGIADIRTVSLCGVGEFTYTVPPFLVLSSHVYQACKLYTCVIQCLHVLYMYMYIFLMRDENEERKKQARSNKQTRQSNTAHPRQSLFLEKISCLGWDSNPRHSIMCSGGTMALRVPAELPGPKS